MYFIVFFEQVDEKYYYTEVLKDCILLYFLNIQGLRVFALGVLKDCILLYFLNDWKFVTFTSAVLKDCILLYFLNFRSYCSGCEKFLRIVFYCIF